jgi:sialic acid synthase SpsE
VGYSDHSEGIHIPIAAVARGAEVIEKHFTLDRSLPGPDHGASLEPSELTAMVSAIRGIEKAIGDGIKRPTSLEIKNRIAARKSLVYANSGVVGQPLEIAVKRPGNGISPFRYWELQGRLASRDFQVDELIDEDS